MLTCSKETLENGLRVVVVEMPHLHSAEIAIYIKTGGRNDPPGKAGLSHFVEHMLFRGTAEHATSLELETAFELIGGSVNAATDEETTCYFSRVHPPCIAEGLGLFSSMLLRPSLLGVDVEKRIITEEALEDINEQGEEINPHNLASRILWPDHPLGAPTIGFLDSIESFTLADLRDHLRRHYLPSNAVVAVAGAVDPADIFASCRAAFGAWEGESLPATLPVSVDQREHASIFVRDSDSQVHLQVAFRGFARNDKRIMPLRLLRRVLCGSGSSRLHISLREKLGIVYSVDASISAYEETGAFAIELSTAPDNVVRAVQEVLKEVSLVASEVMPDDELERVKKCYLYDLEYSKDSTYEMQSRYGWGELMGVVRSVEEDSAEASAVTPGFIRDVAAALFAPQRLNLVAVGAWTNGTREKIEKLLTGYSESWVTRSTRC